MFFSTFYTSIIDTFNWIKYELRKDVLECGTHSGHTLMWYVRRVCRLELVLIGCQDSI